MNNNENPNLRDQVKLTKPEQLYQITNQEGQVIDFETADGRQLFNHYRHNMTNYDQVLDDVRQTQGYVTGRQEKQATLGAAEQILKTYRDEHIKVIQDSQKKGIWIKRWFAKVGVGTAQALSDVLDNWSEQIKNIAQLQNSQRALQTWNDTYRVQRQLVKKLLKEEGVSEEIINKVNRIYGTRSVNKAIELGTDLFNLEKSELLKLMKAAIRYCNNHEDK
jgi:hypothetical protein